MNLIEEKAEDIRLYKKTANIVKKLRNDWDKKMESLQKDSYRLKEAQTNPFISTNT